MDFRGCIAHNLMPSQKKLVMKGEQIYKIYDLDVDDASKLAVLLTYAPYAEELRAPPMVFIQAAAIGELIAPILLDSYFESENNGEELIKRIQYYFDKETPLNKNGKMSDFIAELRKTQMRDKAWEAIHNSITPTEFLLEYDEMYVKFLIAKVPHEYSINAIDMLTTIYLAWVKKGNVTDRVLAEKSRHIEDKFGHKPNLNAKVIGIFYNLYGQCISPGNVNFILELLLQHAQFPKNELLDILPVDTDPIQYAVIQQAKLKYPDFPWNCLNDLFHGEVNIYSGESGIIIRNFLNYSSFSYVARELLIQINGETSLGEDVWKAPVHQDVVKVLIDNYKALYVARSKMGAVVDDKKVDLQSASGDKAHKAKPPGNSKHSSLTITDNALDEVIVMVMLLQSEMQEVKNKLKTLLDKESKKGGNKSEK